MFGYTYKQIAVIAAIAFAVDVVGDVTGLRARVSAALTPSK